jgi:hypothetical protein
MQPTQVRERTIDRLKQDLLGPHSEHEVLTGPRVRPSDVYLTGILWPIGERMGGEDDDGTDGEGDNDEGASTSSPVGQQRPCSMGISFCVEARTETCSVNLAVEFATYSLDKFQETKDGPTLLRWTRRPFRIQIQDLTLPNSEHQRLSLTAEGLHAEVEVHLRARKGPGSRLVTATLINRSQGAEADRDAGEQLTLFQTRMEITPCSGARLIARPGRPALQDEDERIAALLYRDVPEFATGHQCSASWQSSGGFASRISTEWIPRASVHALREDGDEVFASLVTDGSLDAHTLATTTEADLCTRLEQLPLAYGRWIAKTTQRIPSLPTHLQLVATENIEACRRVHDRMVAGVDAIRRDVNIRKAFQLANAAIALQHSWKTKGSAAGLRWRPFQLGFILLSAESTCSRLVPDREILDLLWFPTGGGKTEAYLALIAMLAFHRRLVHDDPDEGRGNAAVMRYTLRLLTAQQFERAAAVILACELIRRNEAPLIQADEALGDTPFSIGLWVGGDATPNTFEIASAKSGARDGCTAEQIDECPCCGGRVRWQYDEGNETVMPFCNGSDCLLGRETFGCWPVFTVDSDIYREQPTLLIGTIDKFALLATKREVRDLFGFGSMRATDLIIQDELHLISGPLGTIAGVYETAFDWLLRKAGRRPKIIGSTATIRRASQQARALFDRQSCQFPPPGLDHDDSGFAVRDPDKAPRVYLGVTTAGRSAKFALQAAAGSLLESTGGSTGLSDKDRDGYSTLLAYFNSLRELGGAIVQMLDDVPDSMKLYAAQHGENVRTIAPPRELTSRVSQKEIIEILAELTIEAGNPGAVDVVLATNMVSVGVDVSRLGAMLLNGQPKTRSEYIQATSRVGRKAFPGLVVAVLNAAKPRDRSHFETFTGWHSSLYRDVEATSVTPFASRSRDRALHAALVAMIRHGHDSMAARPDLSVAPDEFLSAVFEEIQRRVSAIDPRETHACTLELDERLGNWQGRAPTYYLSPRQLNKALLISADLNAQRRASGRLPAEAWPTMNNMRSIEATTLFRLADSLAPPRDAATEAGDGGSPPAAETVRPVPRWRRRDG